MAVVGAGWAARSIWLPRLNAHPGFAVTGIVDPDPEARAAVARAGDMAEFARAENLPASGADLAIVAVPNHLHAAVAETLMRKGLPVFVEKPVCLSSAEADRLALAEFSSTAILLAGSAARYRADVRALLAAADKAGEIRHISLGWERARGVPSGVGWFTHRGMSGGGVLMDLGWHLFDAVSPLLGTARFRHVAGSVSYDFINDISARAKWRGDEPGSVSGDVEDTARGFFQSLEGPSVSFIASWASHRADDLTSIVLEGTDATLKLSCTFGFSPNRLGRSVLTLARDGEEIELPVANEPVGLEYDRLLDDLPRRLADPASRGASIRASARTVDTIERLYISAARPGRTGQHSLPPSRRVRAVLFDLDGVIVNSFEVMRQAFTLAYREVVGEGEPPFAEYNRHLGRYFPDIMRIMGLPQAMEAPFVRESGRLAGQISLFPGVRELLQGLTDRGIKLGVATGKAGWRARSLLNRLQVLDIFEHVIGSDEIARAKPAPDIVLRAMDLLRVDKDEMVMVGDAVTDLIAAKAAGVTAVAALWGAADEVALLAAGPDLVLRSPAELAIYWKQPVDTTPHA